MEAIQQSIHAMTEHFNSQMAEFQKTLEGAIPASSPTSNIGAQFNAFRAFVLSALSGLQQQVEVLAKQTDQLETRSRRKMLLVHGIPETNNSNLSTTVSVALSSHLSLPDIKEDSFSRCQRLGQPRSDKPRALLLKFKDVKLRDQVWFTKSSLKNTGITLSEFLSKDRHDAFMLARQRFGISKSWTRNGIIIIIDEDGKRHRVSTIAEVNSIRNTLVDVQAPSTASGSVKATKQTSKVVTTPQNPYTRQKRTNRK